MNEAKSSSPFSGNGSGGSTSRPSRPRPCLPEMGRGSLNLSMSSSSRRSNINLQLTPSPLDPRGVGVHPRGGMSEAEKERKLKEIMSQTNKLNINGKAVQCDTDDLELLGDLGNGTCGHVVKMRHVPSCTVIAVKQMRRTGNPDEENRILMDLDVVLKSHDCKEIVLCLGCFITNSDVWICMELMATCFDKLLKQLKQPIPEPICGKVAVATLKALNYLKEKHDVIHRDVKPSNILLDAKGRIKLCDFGISGRLVESQAKTRNAGCAAYMAPERIEPPQQGKTGYHYDIRSDVWSLGITLVEMATGQFPYKDCKTDFEVSAKVVQDDPPLLPPSQGFSQDFCCFVRDCLMKNYKDRPKYKKLLQHPFILRYEQEGVDVGNWYRSTQRQLNFSAAAKDVQGLSSQPGAPSVDSFKPQPSPRVQRATYNIYPSAIGEQQRKRDQLLQAATSSTPSQPDTSLSDFSNLRISSSSSASTRQYYHTPPTNDIPKSYYDRWTPRGYPSSFAFSSPLLTRSPRSFRDTSHSSSAFNSPHHLGYSRQASSKSGPPSLQQPDSPAEPYTPPYPRNLEFTFKTSFPASTGTSSGPPSAAYGYGVPYADSQKMSTSSLNSTPQHQVHKTAMGPPSSSLYSSSRNRSLSTEYHRLQQLPPHHPGHEERRSRASKSPSPTRRSSNTDRHRVPSSTATGASGHFSTQSWKNTFSSWGSSWASPISSLRRRTTSTDRSGLPPTPSSSHVTAPGAAGSEVNAPLSQGIAFDRRFQPRFRSWNEKDGGSSYFSSLSMKR